jgi:sec-independent protein translocase protein TatA
MLNFAVGIGPAEIIIVLVIVLLLFGARRLPEVGRSLGQGMREFKDSVTGKDRGEEPEQIDRGERAHESDDEERRHRGERAHASDDEERRDRAPAGRAGTGDPSS